MRRGPPNCACSFQSPLHRGRVFNARRARVVSQIECRLSVPSSSGKGLQQQCPSQLARRWREPFSPLFIGEGSSTANILSSNLTCSTSFQSPLHRGRVFNHHFTAHLRLHAMLSVPSSSGKGLQRRPGRSLFRAADLLSVPSSSGKGLQRRLSHILALDFTSFSPLFIGEGSSTGPGISRRVLRETFSPLFIGEGSSTKRPGRAARSKSPFSPLFIGEGSSTISIALREYRLSPLSVPSSSGKGLQHLHKARSRIGAAPFSPLFIGEGSSTIKIPEVRYQPLVTFSPLFIGEGSSTSARIICSAASAPTFSPLFIGEGSSTGVAGAAIEPAL